MMRQNRFVGNEKSIIPEYCGKIVSSGTKNPSFPKKQLFPKEQ
jgi:hypothetical protein